MVTGHARSASAVGPGQALPVIKVLHIYYGLSIIQRQSLCGGVLGRYFPSWDLLLNR